MEKDIPPPPGPITEWMQRPGPAPDCPVGLEYLTQIDKLQIQQEKSIVEILTTFEKNNKYSIQNGDGLRCYYAEERTGCCSRNCCAERRGFDIFIKDNLGQEVLKVSREFKLCGGCCWLAACCSCFAHIVKIESAQSGEILGYVKQGGSCWKPCYNILDENKEKVLKIVGPCCICDGPWCPCDNEFELRTLDSDQIGGVKKMYAGLFTEFLSDADKFQIEFPMDLCVKSKACLLGALFLIDFMYFEKKQDKKFTYKPDN